MMPRWRLQACSRLAPLPRGKGVRVRPPNDERVRKRRLWWWGLILLCLGCSGPVQTALPDLRQMAVELNDQGYSYYRQSKLRLAQDKFGQALKLNRFIDHRAGIAANLNNLGVILQEQGDLAQAQGHFQEALTLNRELADPAGVSETLNNLGTIYQTQGRVREAQDCYQEALRWARMLPPGPLLTLSLTHLGDLARIRQDYSQALELYGQALAVDEAQKDGAGKSVRWERLGRTYLALRDLKRAETYLQDALTESRRLENTPVIIDTLDGLTRLALARGNRSEARLYGERLLKIYQARGQEQEARQIETLLKTAGGRPN